MNEIDFCLILSAQNQPYHRQVPFQIQRHASNIDCIEQCAIFRRTSTLFELDLLCFFLEVPSFPSEGLWHPLKQEHITNRT